MQRFGAGDESGQEYCAMNVSHWAGLKKMNCLTIATGVSDGSPRVAVRFLKGRTRPGIHTNLPIVFIFRGPQYDFMVPAMSEGFIRQ